MLRTNDATASAFQLLASTVRDFYSKGHRCLGATLKPELYRRGNLLERDFGFAKFGDFLKAAQAAGYVQLTARPGGDIEVWPAGIRILDLESLTPGLSSVSLPMQGGIEGAALKPLDVEAPLASPILRERLPSEGYSSNVPIRVRQDLWNAFNSFSANWIYDPVADMAYKNRRAATETESQSSAASSLIQIPSGRNRVLEWMRSFALMQDAEIQTRLFAVFESESAPYRFNELMRADTRLHRAWSRFHIQQVISAIEAWAASNRIHPKEVILRPLERAQRAIRPETTAFASQQFNTPMSATMPGPLTRRLDSLIDDLIDNLLRLRGLLQVLDADHR